MRRFLAYLVMMLTMISVLFFNTQSVIGNKVDAMEYDQGTQLVYSLTYRNRDDYDNDKYPNITESEAEHLDDIDIEKLVMDRLEIAGVRDSDVKIIKGEQDQGYQLKVTLAPLSEVDLNNVKSILVRTGTLSIGANNDTIFSQDAGEFFADTVAEIVYVGNNAYPAINLIDANAYDELKKAVEESTAEEGDDSTPSEGEEGDTSGDLTAYLWMNKTVEDTYAKAFGTEDTVVSKEVKAKLLATVDLTTYDSSTHQIRLTSDKNGNAFTSSTARAFVNMLNCTDYGFDISYLYSSKVNPHFGIRGLQTTYLTFSIVLLVTVILLIAAYGLAGFSGGVSVLGSVFVSFLLSSLLGFEFSVSFIAGLAVIAFLSTLISGNYFSRVRREIKKGRDVAKANKEGYHKSWLMSIDMSVVCLIASIFSFLISVGSLKTFFGVVMIGTIFTFLITNYVNKWLMYWLTKSENQKLPYFSFYNFEPKKDVMKLAKSKGKANKALLVAIPSVLAALLAIALPVGYTVHGGTSFFTNRDDYAESYTLNIEFDYTGSVNYTPLASKNNYLNYLIEMGKKSSQGNYEMLSADEHDTAEKATSFLYYPETAVVHVAEKKNASGDPYFTYYFSVETDKDLTNLELENTTVINVISDEIRYGTTDISIEDVNGFIRPSASAHFDADSLDVTSYITTPTHIDYNTNNFFLVVFLIAVFAMIYTFLRYGLNLALTQFAVTTLVAATGVGLLAILPIAYNSFTVFGVLLPVLASAIITIPLLGENKETIRARGLKHNATIEQKEEIFEETIHNPTFFVLLSCVTVIISAFGFFFISSQTLGLATIALLVEIMTGVIFYFFGYRFFLFLTTHITFTKFNEKRATWAEKRRIKKNEAKPVASKDGIVYVDQDGPHETIVEGLNEFRK